MLRVQDLKFERGDDVLFEGVNLVVYPGQRVAVVGRNGVGKSTFFNLVLKKLEASGGEVDFPEDWQLGYMAQEVEINDRPAIEFIIDGHKELRKTEKAIANTEDPVKLANLYTQYDDQGGYQSEARAGEILYGLGFNDEEAKKPYRDFSGGWRIRLNLAQALMAPSDMLLLDEPTNHLDLEAILWLETWLKRFQGALLIIAHDRAFLDATVTQVLYLAGAEGKFYKGNYSSFERQRSDELEREQAMAVKHQAQVSHIQQFVDRFRATASKAKQVQSRIKALERMQTQAALHVDSDYRVNFSNPDKVSNPLLSFRKMDLGYGDSVILKQVGQTLLPGARIGVLGANGAGKSTLLKAIVGDLKPLNGQLEKGTHSNIGYFAQHQLESLDMSATAYESMMDVRPDFREQQCRDYLGGWGFNLPMIQRPIKSLSGGEKARFVMAVLASEKPAVLVLDEPTNHLDLDMRDALALALQAYTGAVIIVAHDRSLLAKIVDELWLVENGTLTTYHGDIEDYTAARIENGSASGGGKETAGSKKAQRRDRAAARASLTELRKSVRNFEKEMERSNTKLKAIEDILADQKTYDEMPAEELNDLLAKAANLRKQVDKSEEGWLAASAELESIN